jgi:hypothetical protein
MYTRKSAERGTSIARCKSARDIRFDYVCFSIRMALHMSLG